MGVVRRLTQALQEVSLAVVVGQALKGGGKRKLHLRGVEVKSLEGVPL